MIGPLIASALMLTPAASSAVGKYCCSPAHVGPTFDDSSFRLFFRTQLHPGISLRSVLAGLDRDGLYHTGPETPPTHMNVSFNPPLPPIVKVVEAWAHCSSGRYVHLIFYFMRTNALELEMKEYQGLCSG